MHLKYLCTHCFSSPPSPSCSHALYLLALHLKLSFNLKWSFMNRRRPPSLSPTPSRQSIARPAHAFSHKWSMCWNLLGIWWVPQMSDCDWVCPPTSGRTLFSECIWLWKCTVCYFSLKMKVGYSTVWNLHVTMHILNEVAYTLVYVCVPFSHLHSERSGSIPVLHCCGNLPPRVLLAGDYTRWWAQLQVWGREDFLGLHWLWRADLDFES